MFYKETNTDSEILEINDIMSGCTITEDTITSNHRYCDCNSCDVSISNECRRCLIKYLSIITDKEPRVEIIKRIISEGKATLFEVLCDSLFNIFISNAENCIDYKTIYTLLTTENNIFEYILLISDLVIDDDNKELFTILQSYLAIWIEDFGGHTRDGYYEQCVDSFYDFFDSYINRICGRCIDESNIGLLQVILNSYSVDNYEIDIANLLFDSITRNKLAIFKFLYGYYTLEICEDTVNLYTLANLYKSIFIYDRVDMFRLLYKLSKNCISRQNIVKLLKHNYNQECTRVFTLKTGVILKYKKISVDDLSINI